MNLDEFQRLLWIYAVEETDGKGAVLPKSERHLATKEAAAVIDKEAPRSSEARFLIRRTRRLTEWLERNRPDARPAGHPLTNVRLIAAALIVAAAVLGFLSNELGPEKRINILSFPLLGMLAWNVAIYFVELIRVAASVGKPPKSMRWLMPLEQAKSPETGHAQVLYSAEWIKATGPALRARLRGTLHFAAAVMAGSAVAGMYVQGLANDYRAIWESTFLDLESLRRLLEIVLGPASAVTGIPIPPTPLEAMHWQPDAPVPGEPAASWIHLYAVTVAIFILAPRALLAFLWSLRRRRLESRLSLRDLAPMYVDRLMAGASGVRLEARVIPYSIQITEKTRETVEKELESLFNSPIRLDWTSPLSFGSESDVVDRLAPPLPPHVVLLFSFSSTPEEETHGALIRETQQKLNAQDSSPSLRVILDASDFDANRRNLPDLEERRSERLAAWRGLLENDADRISVITA